LVKERTSGVLTEVGRGQKGSIFVKGKQWYVQEKPAELLEDYKFGK
jgi:hypothetical protein